MGQKVKELAQPTAGGAVCNPERGGCCSMHRRKDRVYMDQVWKWAQRNIGRSPFKDQSSD